MSLHPQDLPVSRREALTYRHPRTLVEAFGPDARTACAIEYSDDAPDALGVCKGLLHWSCLVCAGAVLVLLVTLLF